jgi:hypothetical protein
VLDISCGLTKCVAIDKGKEEKLRVCMVDDHVFSVSWCEGRFIHSRTDSVSFFPFFPTWSSPIDM